MMMLSKVGNQDWRSRNRASAHLGTARVQVLVGTFWRRRRQQRVRERIFTV